MTPTVTYADAGAAGTYEVSGLVPDVVEDGGSCVVELTQGDVTVRREQAATADATSTTCGSIVVPAADLRPGSWSVVLRYASPWSAGSSAAVDLEVR
ncbi:hypothetical protein [Cellulomonas hominis]|uniref:hypothetical protein n=1 Tax=Cellulomonas hominis TaxID=156981 RepID=UPI001443BD98|nr:hypothetical protein [Cellulomonas hominis]NKY09928.1 hypothetical protein [Cellulomonas hominis]